MAQATCIALKIGAYLQHNLQVMQHFLITSPFFWKSYHTAERKTPTCFELKSTNGGADLFHVFVFSWS